MNLETNEKSQIEKIALEKEENLAEDFFTGVLSSVILGSVNTIRNINNNPNKLNNQMYSQNVSNNVNLPGNNAINQQLNTQQNSPLNEQSQNNNINQSIVNSRQIEKTNVLKKISKWAFDKIGNLKSFKEQINDYRNNLLPSGTNLIISDTSTGLEYANILDNPIVINQSNIKKVLTDKHSNIDSEIIENLDLELNNSVFAMDSLTQNNSRVIVLDKFDKNGNPIIVTIKLNKTNASVEVNEVTSVYDKREFQNFINRTIENNKNVYTNEKTEQWLLRNRLQLPTRFANSSVLNSNNTIIRSKSQIAH